jgi:peptide/nickel transport system ATP-binding protein
MNATSQEPARLLDVAELTVSFATERELIPAVTDVSFKVGQSEIVSIVGESGSGKTVALLSILGLTDRRNTKVQGSVTFRGRSLLDLPEREMRRIRGRDIGFISQDPMTALTPVHTVGWQIEEQIRVHLNLSRAAARRRAVELLDEVGLADPAKALDLYPHQLSGGMRQRAVIAMALSCNPSLLVADEPTTGLDVTVQAQVLGLLRRLRVDFGLSIILVTHDLGVVGEMADRVLVMYAGRVVERAPTDVVFEDPWHPYTWGLLASIPQLHGERSVRLSPIPGAPPAFTALPKGCGFAPRCRFRFGPCAETPPSHENGEHAALCFIDPSSRPRLREQVLNPSLIGQPELMSADSSAVPLVEAEGLTKRYLVGRTIMSGSGRALHAVDGVSLTIWPGETLGLVGESGCGKSTLGCCLTRLYDIDDGTLRFEGMDITKSSRRQLRPFRRRMQMIFQDPSASLNPRRRIGDLIADPLHAHAIRSRENIPARLRELMDLVGLPAAYLERYPHEFSGGQRQRIGIARALAMEPSLIVADEPVSALDVSVQAQIVNLFTELRERLSLTYIFIAHDLAVVRHVSTRTAVMYLGSIVETGPTDLIFDRPAHPYTEALLSAIPAPRARGAGPSERIILKGELPSPLDPPGGCKFSTRCPIVSERCRSERPQLRPLSDGHSVACHFPRRTNEDASADLKASEGRAPVGNPTSIGGTRRSGTESMVDNRSAPETFRRARLA